MIDDVFTKVPMDIGRSLFADDGALWKGEGIWSMQSGKYKEQFDEVVEWGMIGGLSSQ